LARRSFVRTSESLPDIEVAAAQQAEVQAEELRRVSTSDAIRSGADRGVVGLYGQANSVFVSEGLVSGSEGDDEGAGRRRRRKLSRERWR
jgi:hypothetical protein